MKKKKSFEDDNNMTVADMNVEGMPWYQSKKVQEQRKNINEMNFTKKEKKAMIKGAYRAYLPYFLIFVGCFSLVFGLLFLWLWLNS